MRKDILNKSLSARTLIIIAVAISLLIFLLTRSFGIPLLFLALAVIAAVREWRNKRAIKRGLEPTHGKHVKYGGLIILGILVLVILLVIFIASFG